MTAPPSGAAPVVRVTRRVVFSAARRLTSAKLDDAADDRLFGADRRLHGREFALFVTLRGPAPPETGMVMDLKALSELLKAEIVRPLDRTVLNDAELLAGRPPTTENLAVAVWRRIETRLPKGLLAEVTLREGEAKTVTYRGERRPDARPRR